MLFYKWDHELDHNWAHQLVRVLVHMLGLKKEKNIYLNLILLRKKIFNSKLILNYFIVDYQTYCESVLSVHVRGILNKPSNKFKIH